MKAMEAIIKGLDTIQKEAEHKEDGNAHALVQKLVRELSSLNPHYATLEMDKNPYAKDLATIGVDNDELTPKLTPSPVFSTESAKKPKADI